MGSIRLGKRTEDRSPIIKDFAPLADLDNLVFGGWDIADENVFRLLEPIATLINSTDGVLCAYLDNTTNNQPSLKLTSTSQWFCTGGTRILSANGIPDHTVGTFPNANNPHAISEQAVSAEFTLAPRKTSNATEFGGPNVVGYILNGVKVDAGTAGTCNDSGSNCSLSGGTGSWSIEALGQSHFDFGDDSNHAHVQPGGAYHYHGVPEGFVEKRGGSASKMTIIGWAADGFPIYSRYGYSIAGQSNSNVGGDTIRIEQHIEDQMLARSGWDYKLSLIHI